jgi:molybdate transport system substrate-binding protein
MWTSLDRGGACRQLARGRAARDARARLSLVTPARVARQIAGVKDLAAPGARWAPTLPDTPLASATTCMFERANALAAYGPTFRAQADRNVLMRVGSVNDLLLRVAGGEADAGVVFSSDVPPEARTQPRVDINELVDFLSLC